MRADLGITIRDTEPSPVPAPADAPRLSIVAVVGRLIKVRLRDQTNPERRGRPAGAQGAAILYHVGESPSNDPSQWALAQITSRATFDVEIPATVAPGSRVWFTAFWFNARKDSSPYAQPKSTIIGDGVARLAA